MKRRRILAATAAFFVALTAASVPRAQAAASGGCPIVVAHATGAHIAPENTAIGITMSAATGASMVEMDVRWSYGLNTEASPGYPVLMHDATVDRTTGGTGAVDAIAFGLTKLTKLSAAEYAPWNTDARFKGFKADGSPVVGVPHAGEFVGASATAHVDELLDVKATPGEWAAKKLLQYIDGRSYRPHTIYMAAPASVTAMRQWAPDLRYAVIEYPPAGRVYTPQYLASLGASIYAVPWDRITPGLVAYMHSAGIQVYTWTSDNDAFETVANFQALRLAGVDALITDEPAAAIAAYAPFCAAPSPSGSEG